eukprot:gene8279-5970_t
MMTPVEGDSLKTHATRPAVAAVGTYATPPGSQKAAAYFGQPATQQPPLAPPPPPPAAFDPNQPRRWSSGVCDCLTDEESCWWGTWCCCVLFGRNVETFGVGSSLQMVNVVSAWLLLSFAGLLLFNRLFFWSMLLGGVAFTVYRARQRSAMRRKVNLVGDDLGDCCVHCFLKQCATCQEAREAKVLRLAELDYVSGQDLRELAARDDETPPATAAQLYASLSQTSQLIAKVAAVFVVFLTLLLAVRRPSYLAILALVFLQPAAILYVVYWRQRRQFVQADYVVKLFVVGFFMATTQSIVFEEALQTLISVALFIVFVLLNGDVASRVPDHNDGPSDPEASSAFFAQFAAQSEAVDGATAFWRSAQLLRGAQTRPLLRSLLVSTQELFACAFALPASAPAVVEAAEAQLFAPLPALSRAVAAALAPSADAVDEFAFAAPTAYATPTPFAAVVSPMLAAVSNGSSPDATDDFAGLFDRSQLRSNAWLLVLYLFLLAFVVAAGVEETMKHFAVRCCRFPQALKEPQTIMVYLLTAALGFATAENIEYVLGARASPVAGVSLFVGELFILFVRILLPIHLVCAVLQATEMSRRDTGIDPTMPLPRLLLPAVLLHGSFDFFLFLMSALQFVYAIDSVAFDVFTLLFPFAIAVGGVVWAARSFGAVEAAYRSEWRPLHEHHAATPADYESATNSSGSDGGSEAGDVEVQLSAIHTPSGSLRLT